MHMSKSLPTLMCTPHILWVVSVSSFKGYAHSAKLASFPAPGSAGPGSIVQRLRALPRLKGVAGPSFFVQNVPQCKDAEDRNGSKGAVGHTTSRPCLEPCRSISRERRHSVHAVDRPRSPSLSSRPPIDRMDATSTPSYTHTNTRTRLM